MKKTKKTVMTAALFAAAMNLVPSGALEAVMSNDITDTVYAVDESGNEGIIESIENDFQGVYGPPWMMLPESHWRGDVCEDGVIDVYDIIALRKYLLNGTDSETDEKWDAMRADVNGDGKVGIADMITLQKYIMGQISGLTSVVTPPTTEPATEPPTEHPTETEPVPVPVYGPPSMFE